MGFGEVEVDVLPILMIYGPRQQRLQRARHSALGQGYGGVIYIPDGEGDSGGCGDGDGIGSGDTSFVAQGDGWSVIRVESPLCLL